MAYQEDIQMKIIADNIEDCRAKLFKEYGQDYSIIDTKKVRVGYGPFKMLKKDVLEFTYVVEHQPRVREKPMMNEEEILAKNRESILKANEDKLVNAKINQLNDTMQDFISNFDKKISSISVNTSEKHESIKRIEELLELNEFSFSYINMIEEKLRASFSLEALDDFDIIQRKVVDWIGESITIAKETVFRPPHVYIIVGPTGVGKTTTLVKMVREYVLSYKDKYKHDPKFCLITTDLMRVGAYEQIKRWGDIFHTDILKADKPEDLVTLYKENVSNMDAIFVDTSGFSPNDANHLAKIKMLLDVPGMNPDVYLAFSASTKTSDLINIIKNYEPFGYNSIIVTKCDETCHYGNVISVLNERHKSISYITTGQQVARDMEKASVVNFLINLEGFKIDRVHIEELFGE